MGDAEMWKAFHQMRTVLKEHIARNSEKWKSQVEHNSRQNASNKEFGDRIDALEEVRWKSTGAMIIVATLLNSALALIIGYLLK